MAHGLFTDAATRFNKGQSPLQNMVIAAKVADEIKQLAGGVLAGDWIDDRHLSDDMVERNAVHPPVKLRASFVHERLGLKLDTNEMKQLLENVECTVVIEGDELIVTAPFWRTDIELREDVVEEIGRLYGYDHLPLELPQRDLTPAKKDVLLSAKASIRQRLATAGANEVLTYSFVPAKLLERAGQSPDKAYQIGNALSPDLQYYRLSLMPSLLDKVHPNMKAGYGSFALFELGKTHGLDNGVDDDGVPVEHEFTGLVVAQNSKQEIAGAAYYQAKRFLEELTRAELTYKTISDSMQQYPVIQPYERNRAALVSVKDGPFLGIIGEFKPSVQRNFKLPKYAAGFEVDTAELAKILAAGYSYTPLSKFPAVTQDITLQVEASSSWQAVNDFVRGAMNKHAPKDVSVSVEPLDIFQADDAPEHKRLTFRCVVVSDERTLTGAEVTKVFDAVAQAAKAELNADRV
jgi:phenylalanyl-tRNA synthetase beta chain